MERKRQRKKCVVKRFAFFYQRRERIHVEKSLSLHYTSLGYFQFVWMDGIDEMIQNHQRNSQVIIIINQLYTDRHCGINVAIRKSATATDKERKLCEASHEEGDKKPQTCTRTPHSNNELAIHFSYTHFVISRLHSSSFCCACFGIHNSSHVCQQFFSACLGFQPHFLPTMLQRYFTSHFTRPVCVCVCVCYCFLCFHLKMINRFFFRFLNGRARLPLFQVYACVCVWPFRL